MPLTFTCLELYSPNANIYYTGLFKAMEVGGGGGKPGPLVLFLVLQNNPPS